MGACSNCGVPCCAEPECVSAVVTAIALEHLYGSSSDALRHAKAIRDSMPDYSALKIHWEAVGKVISK